MKIITKIKCFLSLHDYSKVVHYQRIFAEDYKFNVCKHCGVVDKKSGNFQLYFDNMWNNIRKIYETN